MYLTRQNIFSSSVSEAEMFDSNFHFFPILDADDLPRFHDMLDGAPVTVSRGTCTREYHVIHRETSPVRFLAETKVSMLDNS